MNGFTAPDKTTLVDIVGALAVIIGGVLCVVFAYYTGWPWMASAMEELSTASLGGPETYTVLLLIWLAPMTTAAALFFLFSVIINGASSAKHQD